MKIKPRNQENMEFIQTSPESPFGKIVCYDKNGYIIHYSNEIHQTIAEYIMSGELDPETFSGVIFYENNTK